MQKIILLVFFLFSVGRSDCIPVPCDPEAQAKTSSILSKMESADSEVNKELTIYNENILKEQKLLIEIILLQNKYQSAIGSKEVLISNLIQTVARTVNIMEKTK